MLHHVGDVPFPPVVELHAVVILCLAVVPYIERLDHHHHSHLIAELYEFRSRHVMTGTDCIATHLFEHRDLVLEGVLMHRST